ncbi:hypothetical protein L2E82_16948 [Cichorium intybus]|uniref:Uncharacterized protein n=1 Tax=Cichorium intybus TaxID=13427 RepID=A0ACB9F891_CICIN|nr:hypothetical protein L2E82_16948 [Cichorium intybus]
MSLLKELKQLLLLVTLLIDWSSCDILRSGCLPGEKCQHQPHMYFAADDLEHQAVFPCERLGMGAFRIALESIFNRLRI